MKYAVVIERGSTSFGARVPDLPGCVAVADTREEVLRLIQDTIQLHLESESAMAAQVARRRPASNSSAIREASRRSLRRLFPQNQHPASTCLSSIGRGESRENHSNVDSLRMKDNKSLNPDALKGAAQFKR